MSPYPILPLKLPLFLTFHVPQLHPNGCVYKLFLFCTHFITSLVGRRFLQPYLLLSVLLHLVAMSSNHVCQVCLRAFGSLRGLSTHVNQQSLCQNSHAPAYKPGFQDGRRSHPTPNSRSRLTSDDGVCWSQQSPRSPDGGDGGEADASMSSSSGIGQYQP
jgi:hypothetical protein